jgi:hypothetical protein
VVSLDDTYQDLRNLGAIFGVPQRAAHVIAAMQAQVAAVRAKVAGLAPIKVFDYDSGESAPFTGAGLATVNADIVLAGGTNIFGSLKKSFDSVSWEQVVAAQPQCIIINDYGTPTAAQKEKFLETFSASKNLPAVRNRCFLPLSYDEVVPGPRDAKAVVAIARWLHPAAFGLGLQMGGDLGRQRRQRGLVIARAEGGVDDDEGDVPLARDDGVRACVGLVADAGDGGQMVLRHDVPQAGDVRGQAGRG